MEIDPNDPDQTEGRRLYELKAEALVQAQINFAARRKWIQPREEARAILGSRSDDPVG